MKLVSFLLVAGAEAGSPSAIRGIFTFCVDVPPSWGSGTSVPHLMLLAGASAHDPSSMGGSLTFDAGGSPSDAWLDLGSALSCEYPA